MNDFVADAKKRPGQINVAILGPTGLPAISMFEMQELLNIRVNLVTYESGADGTAALLGGHVAAQSVPASRTVTLHKGGQIRILSVFDEKRMKELPDVPTFKEATGKQLIMSAVRGLVCQSGVPKERFQILRSAWNKILKNDEMMKKLEKIQPNYPRTGEEFEKYCIEQIPVSKRAQELINRLSKTK
jgi:tripartite-type tricarboxylate transporter receptor subunit TctC